MQSSSAPQLDLQALTGIVITLTEAPSGGPPVSIAGGIKPSRRRRLRRSVNWGGGHLRCRGPTHSPRNGRGPMTS